ncbi:hypothetical protein B4U29_11420, partial [Klebsiella pneumoniae]
LCHGTVCVVGKMRDLILQLSKSSIYSTKPSVTSCLSIISKQHALQTTCGFLQLSILNKRRGDKADNASFSMEALFHNPSGLASCMNSIRRRSPVGNCRRLE